MSSPVERLTPLRLLLWCAAGTVIAQLIVWRITTQGGVSPIFWYLLKVYDTHGNVLLLLVAVAAFALRNRADALDLVRLAAERPWAAAAIAFPLLCVGSLQVYRGYPVSMDEYSTLFQAKVFAAGRLDGAFPPDLLDRLVPYAFQGQFFSVSRATGAISTTYWPAFPLLLAPFAWLGIPWAANPLLAALTLPAVHGIAKQVTGSKEAAGWALLLTAASPVFVVNSISLYSMPAHLLCNLWYARLLLEPTPRRAALAGVLGSIALTLHYPFRHALFAIPFLAWVALRPGRVAHLAALGAGYLPLGLLLGVGWHEHIMDPLRAAGAAPQAALPQATAPAAAAPAAAQPSPLWRALEFVRFPALATLESRTAALTKDWTWGAAGLVVLAVAGAVAHRNRGTTRLLVSVLGLTFLGYLLAPGDQGHGWGHRSLYQAWFVYPILAAGALVSVPQVQRMAAWCVVLSLVLANGLRLVQVYGFVGQHLRQVPPLARAADPARPQVVFVNTAKGFYTRDMIQNDPFLRGPRITMVMGPSASADALMAARFPGYRKVSEGEWGQLWERAAGK